MAMVKGLSGWSWVARPPLARAQMASASSGGTRVVAGTGCDGASMVPTNEIAGRNRAAPATPAISRPNK